MTSMHISPEYRLCALLFVVLLTWPALTRLISRLLFNARGAAIVAGLFVVAILSFAVLSARKGAFYDPVEPLVASLSWKLVQGDKLYPALYGARLYSLPYGPTTFLFYGAMLQLAGPSIACLKWSIVALMTLSLSIVYGTLRATFRRSAAIAGCGYLATLMLSIAIDLLWVRGEGVGLVLSSLALLASLLGNEVVGIITFALAFGLLVNVKITFLVYGLPLVYIFVTQRGRRPAILALALSGLVFAAPFLFPTIGLGNYLAALRLVSHRPWSLSLFWHILGWAAVIAAGPLVVAAAMLNAKDPATARALLKANRNLLLAIVICAVALIPLASMLGAGSYHLAPLFPILTFLFAGIIEQNSRSFSSAAGSTGSSGWQRAAQAFAIAVAVRVLLLGYYEYRVFAHRSRGWTNVYSQSVIADLQNVVRANPGSHIEMGYGTINTYAITWFQPVLEFAGQPLTIAPMSMMDRQIAGVDIPPATLEWLRSCQGKKWLVPKNDRPFDLENLLDFGTAVHRNTFGKLFPAQFRDSYAVSGTTQHFDVWSCKTDASAKELTP